MPVELPKDTIRRNEAQTRLERLAAAGTLKVEKAGTLKRVWAWLRGRRRSHAG